MEQVLYIGIIAVAMLFGWILYQRRSEDAARDRQASGRRSRKPRPRKRS